MATFPDFSILAASWSKFSIDRSQLRFHFFNELSFLRESVILGILCNVLYLLLDPIEVIRGGRVLAADH